MSYLQVKDLKKSKELWEKLEKEREIIITKDGQPKAIMIGIEPDELESSLREIRRSLFSAAVSRVRRRAYGQTGIESDVAEAVRESRIK
jgi:hypothetical protein